MAYSQSFGDTRIINVIAVLIDARGHYTLREVVGGWSLSDRRLQQLFRREVGASMQAFWMSGRLHMAASSLASDVHSVKHAMIDAGFRDPAVFCRHFRRHFGEPPSRFRLAARSSLGVECAEGWSCPWMRVTAGVIR
jgi:AraC-like DNA-binding protein